MNTPPETTGTIRQVQALTVLLSCLPPDGKARELFSLALALDEAPWLERIAPVVDPERDEGVAAWIDRINPGLDSESNEALNDWLECVWIRSDLDSGEQALVDWQTDSDNMNAALAEYLGVLGKLRLVRG
jgi:hypothetical protein